MTGATCEPLLGLTAYGWPRFSEANYVQVTDALQGISVSRQSQQVIARPNPRFKSLSGDGLRGHYSETLCLER